LRWKAVIGKKLKMNHRKGPKCSAQARDGQRKGPQDGSVARKQTKRQRNSKRKNRELGGRWQTFHRDNPTEDES